MSSRVFISGLGHVSTFGSDNAALLAGVRRESSPRRSSSNIETRNGVRHVEYLLAVEEELPLEVPDSIKRRMPRVSKMAYATAVRALSSAFGTNKFANPERAALIVGTAFASLNVANDSDRGFILRGASGVSPMLFAGSVQNSLAAHLSISFGVQGPVTTVPTMEQTVVASLRMAYDWLKQDVVDHVLVVLGDELSYYHQYWSAHHQEAPIAGEGFASFVLSRSADGALAELTDVWVTADSACDIGNSERTLRASGESAFGYFVTNAALEIATAALLVQSDGAPTCVLQGSASQGVRLSRP